MKIRTLVVLALAVAVPALACAKKPKKAELAVEVPSEAKAQALEEEAEPVITEECVVNVSLFHESLKNKMYADAYEPWWEVYTTCPNANKSIYSDGAKIVEALYQAASDPAEKCLKNRVRYICYGKTRKQTECDGQTGYTVHILDDIVDGLIHSIFEKMRSIPKSEIVIGRYHEKMLYQGTKLLN